VKNNFSKIIKFFQFHFFYNDKKYIQELNVFNKYFSKTFEATITLSENIAGYPFIKLLNENTAIIGVDSNAKPSMLKNPACSTGEIKEKTIKALKQILEHESLQGKTKIVLLHHYLHTWEYILSHIPDKTIAKFIQLYNRDSLINLLNKYNVDLVLHGHYHLNSKYWVVEQKLLVLNGGGSAFYNKWNTVNIESGKVFVQ